MRTWLTHYRFTSDLISLDFEDLYYDVYDLIESIKEIEEGNPQESLEICYLMYDIDNLWDQFNRMVERGDFADVI